MDQAERAAVEVLARLASDALQDRVAALATAAAAGLWLFDEPAQRLLGDDDPHVRAAAAETLGRLAWPGDEEALRARVEALARASRDEVAEVRRAAVLALGNFPLPQASRELRRLARSDGEERALAERALRALQDAVVIQRLTTWLTQGEELAERSVPAAWQVARAAAAVTGRKPAALDEAAVLLSTPDIEIVRPLVAHTARRGEAKLRLAALTLLREKPLPGDVGVLTKLVDDADAAVRLAAVGALGRHLGPEVARRLAERLLAEERARSFEIMKAVGAALRGQETKDLTAALEDVLAAGGRYAIELAVFLARERRGRDGIAVRALALSRDPNAAARDELLAETVEDRLAVLGPRAAALLPQVAVHAVPADRLVVVLGLLAPLDESTATLLLGALGEAPSQPAAVLAEIGRLCAPLADELVLPTLRRAMVSTTDGEARLALYEMLLARPAAAAATFASECLRAETEPDLLTRVLPRVADRKAPTLLAAVASFVDPHQPNAVVRAALQALVRAEVAGLAAAAAKVVRETQDDDVAVEAHALLAARPGDDALQALRALAADRTLALSRRQRAIAALGDRGTSEDLPLLEDVARGSEVELRGPARNAAHGLAPDLYPAWDREGRVPLTLAAAGFGATMLHFISRIGERPDQETLLFGLGGAAIGASTAWLFTLQNEVSLGEAGYFTTLGAWSGLGGYSLTRAAGFGEGDAANLWGAIGGELAGLGIATLSLRAARWDLRDVAFANAFAASWGWGGTSLLRLTRSWPGRANDIDAFNLGGLAAMVPMALAGGRLHIDGDDLVGMMLTAGLASWLGAFAPYAIYEDPRSGDALAGVGFGQAIGITGGLVLTRFRPVDLRLAGALGIGALTGAALGGGIGLGSARLQGRPTYALVEAGTLVGAGAFALVAPHLEFRGTDPWLILLTAAGGGLSGSGWAEEIIEEAGARGIVDRRMNERRRWGGRLVGTSLGFLGGLAVSQVVDLSRGELAMSLVAGGIAGAGAGGVPLLSRGLDDRDFSLFFGLGAALGGFGVALAAPELRFTRYDFLLTASTLALGGALGSFVPAYWADEEKALAPTQRIGGTLVGGALGALAAGVVSQGTEVSGRQLLRIDIAALGGLALGAGLGMVVPSFDRRADAALLQAGGLVGYLGAALTERRAEYTAADRARMTLLAAAGGLYGSTIPRLWRRGEIPLEEIEGGVLVGVAAGGALGRLAVHAAPVGDTEILEIALLAGLGTALGLGSFAYPVGDERNRYRLVVGGGLLGWGLGEIVSLRTRYSSTDRVLVAALAGEGTLGGMALPYWLGLERRDRRARAAGAALGAGTLGLAAIGLTQAVDYEGDDVAEALFWSGIGSLAGHGIAGSLHSGDGESRLLAGAAGLWAGLGIGLLGAPWTDFTDDDGTWALAGSAVGAYAGFRAPRARGTNVTSSHERNGALAGAALGVALSAAAVQSFAFTDAHALGGLTVAGSLALSLEGLARMGLPAPLDTRAAVGMAGALGGYVLGAFWLSGTELDEGDIKTIATLSALTSWHGLFLPGALGETDRRHREGGASSGAGAGVLLGLGLTPFVDLSLADDIELLFASGVGSLLGYGLAATLGWSTPRSFGALEVASLASLGVGALVAPHTRYGSGDWALLAMGAPWGAWHAWLARRVLREGGGADAGRRAEGGLLLGSGVGLAGMALTSQLIDRTAADVVEANLAMGVGALVGGGFGNLRQLGERNVGLLAVGGSLAGLATGLALAPRTTYEGSDVLLSLLTGAIGASHGALLGAMFVRAGGEIEPLPVFGGVQLGTGLGIGAGMLLSQRLALRGGDVAEIGLATLAGDGIGFGLAAWLELEGPAFYGAIEASALAATALGLWAAERTRFDAADRLLTLFGAALGGWLGGVAPRIWRDTRREALGGGVLLGAGVGGLASAFASQHVALDGTDVGEVVLGSSLASAFGAGLGLVIAKDERLWVSLMEGTGVLGALGVTVLAPSTEYSQRDAILGALAALYGVYQGVGLTTLTNARSEQVVGAVLAAGSVGALTGSYFGRYLHLDSTEILMLLAGSAWGLWIGGWSAAAIHESGLKSGNVFALGVGTTAVATDVTLVATSIAISKLVRMPPERFAWISLAGGLGIFAGASAGVLQGGRRGLIAGNVIGTAAGLTLGTVVTGFFDFEPKPAARAAPSATPRASSLLPEIDLVLPSVQVVPDEARPALGPRVLFTLTGCFH